MIVYLTYPIVVSKENMSKTCLSVSNYINKICRLMPHLIRKVDHLALQILSHIIYICLLIAFHSASNKILEVNTPKRHRTCLFPLSSSCTCLANFPTRQIVLLCCQVEYVFWRLVWCRTCKLNCSVAVLGTSCILQFHRFSQPTYLCGV